MTAPLATLGRDLARDLDRACELASIGAGHAAGALASLIGRPCEMCVPAVRALAPGHFAEPFASDLGADPQSWAGMLFEVQGGPAGVLALLFPPRAVDQLLTALLGAQAAAAEQRESALREVGNILASHALSAIGDTLRTVVLPSLPALVMRNAPAAFEGLLSERPEEGPQLRVEVELRERGNGLCGLLVYATALGARGATPRPL